MLQGEALSLSIHRLPTQDMGLVGIVMYNKLEL